MSNNIGKNCAGWLIQVGYVRVSVVSDQGTVALVCTRAPGVGGVLGRFLAWPFSSLHAAPILCSVLRHRSVSLLILEDAVILDRAPGFMSPRLSFDLPSTAGVPAWCGNSAYCFLGYRYCRLAHCGSE